MDYTPAYKYGNIEFITDFDPPLVIRGSTLSHRWYAQVLKAIAKFDIEQDYLIVTGAPLAIFMVGAMFSRLGVDKLPRLLVWRREQNAYVVYDGLDVLETLASPKLEAGAALALN
jgi:hypothetical protein